MLAHKSIRYFSQRQLHAYTVHRNSQGSLPVYTDIRNGGTRILTLIRNVDGADVSLLPKYLLSFTHRIKALATEIKATLFKHENFKIDVKRSSEVVIPARVKRTVVDWLISKGF